MKPPSVKDFFRTLRARLVLGVVLVHALMMTIFVVDQGWRRRSELLDDCEADVRSHVRVLAASVENALNADDIAALQELVVRNRVHPDIVYVAVADGSGLILAHSDRTKRGQSFTDLSDERREMILSRTPDLVDAIAPVVTANRHVGWVRVGMGFHDAGLRFRRVVMGGVVYTSAAALISIAVAWFAARLITRSMADIQTTIDRVQAGDRSARTGVKGRDEVSRLAEAFDALLDKIDERDANLTASEERFRTLFDESPVAIWVDDLSAVKARFDALRAAGVTDFRTHFERNPDEIAVLASSVRVKAVNRRSVELLKAGSSEEICRDLPRYFNAESLRVFREEIIALAAGNTRFQSEATLVNALGEPVIVEMSLVVQPGYEDTLGSVIVSFSDLTERRHMEAEHSRLESQLHQSQKLEPVGRLAGGVAHDFNNMLTVILGQTEQALTRTAPDSPVHGELIEVRKAAERSVSLVRQLLAFARKQVVAPRVVDLNEIIGGMVNMLRRLVGENLRFEWRAEPGVWPVKIDPGQVDQILANLCVNARDAIADIGCIRVALRNASFSPDDAKTLPDCAPGDYVEISVADDGCGMTPEILANIFEPFFTTKGPGKGTGLGLATVYGIVRQNHGFIRVQSEPGRGSRFQIFLPRSPDAIAAPSESAPVAESVCSDMRILLVEDEPAILELVTQMLKSHGHTVHAASTPARALELCHEHSGEIDLLISDVIMPDMNGHDLAIAVRREQPNLRVLFMSGHTVEIISGDGELEPGVHFIQKPFSKSELQAKVAGILGGPSVA